MPSRQLSTRPQRFAHARLPGPHLTRSHAPFPRRSPPSVFSRAQLEVVWSLPPQGDPRGPTILHLLRSTASSKVTYPIRPSLPRSWRNGPRWHTARAPRCPHTCWPGWPPASPTLCRRAGPDGAAPHHWPWRSAWTPLGRSSWTGCRTGAPAGRWGSPSPRSATAWTCCWARLATSGSASPTARSPPASMTCARCWPRWPPPGRRSWWTGWPPGCNDPPRGPTSRCCTTSSGTPTPREGLAVATIWGDLLWVGGGWPGSCHEHELMALAGLEQALDDVAVASLLDRGYGHPQYPVGRLRHRGNLACFPARVD